MALNATLHFAPQYPMPAPLLEREATLRRGPRFFSERQNETLEALCHRVLPQATPRVAVPLAAVLDARCYAGLDNAAAAGKQWCQALDALDAEAQQRYHQRFTALRGREQDALLLALRTGTLRHPAWGTLCQQTFFRQRLLHDVSTAYYSHPAAWPSPSIIGSFAFSTATSQE